MTNTFLKDERIVLHSQRNSSIVRFPAGPILKTLITLKSRHAIKRIFISCSEGLIPVKTTSQRYTLFKKKKRCVYCNRIGSIMSLEQQKHKNRNTPTFHFNLYCIENRKAILMTKDHIIPKSKGGKNHLHNYQTMCQFCNSKKSNKM